MNATGDCAGFNVSSVPPEKRRMGSPPNQALDYVVVAIIAFALIPFIWGNVVMLWHRTYFPIRCKAVNATLTSSIGGLIWICATIVVNGHFGRPKGTFWTVCTLWTFWLQLGLGFALWLNCLVARLWKLYRLILYTKEMRERDFWIFLVILLLPMLVFCIIASAFHASNFRCVVFSNGDIRGDCIIKNLAWAVAALVLLPLYFILLVFFTVRLRDLRDEFNEFSTIRNGGIMAFFLFFLAMVMLYTKTYYYVAGRCFFTLAVSAEVFYFFWIRNWEPIWNVLFHKEEYLDRFKGELRRWGYRKQDAKMKEMDALAVQYIKADGGHAGHGGEGAKDDVEMQAPGVEAERIAQLETLLAAARDEAAQHKGKAAELEAANHQLREQLSRLQPESRTHELPETEANGNGLTQENVLSPKANDG